MSELKHAIAADRLSKVYQQAASDTALPPEATCLLMSAAIEKAIESIFWCNALTPPNRDQALFIFTEKFVLNGGFPRGIEKEIGTLYRMRDGVADLKEDGGIQIAKKVLKELHRTVKAWLIEKSQDVK